MSGERVQDRVEGLGVRCASAASSLPFVHVQPEMFAVLIAAGHAYLAHADEHVTPSPSAIISPNNAN